MIRPGARTLYELALIKGRSPLFLIMYTSHRGRRTLLDCVYQHRESLVAITGADTIKLEKKSADGAMIGEWRINWTGRTQREAATSKLPWIGDWRKGI